ncbi:MAG: TAXI family TRAP transporter solute-binding subunit [Geminicoccaceae bacterium]
MRTDRRRVLAGAAALSGLGAFSAFAQDMRLFRIGTGGIAGTYYPIGGLIAAIISQPSGARSCDDGGSCGVPGLAAIVQSSNGSVDNIDGIVDGRIESGFVQSDVAYFAYTGTGAFAGRKPIESLRLLASLYVESVHLVVAAESGIESIDDLRGRRVSLDSMGSGTQIDALLLLEGHGLTTDDIVAYHAKPEQAVRLMAQGALDAFFIVGGYPIPSVVEAASALGARLAPIDGEAATALVETSPFFSRDVIPGGVYAGVGPTPTLAVVSAVAGDARLDEALVTTSSRPGTPRHAPARCRPMRRAGRSPSRRRSTGPPSAASRRRALLPRGRAAAPGG